MVALRETKPAVSPERPALRVVDAEPPPMPRVRADALPEHMEFPDTGCELARSCLRCPLRRCQYDAGGVRRLTIDERDGEIALLHRRHRAPIAALARVYSLSRRSIFRILREQQVIEGEQRRLL